MKVFKKVEKQLPQLTTLDLQYVSPELLKARNLDLAVPGKCYQGNEVSSSFKPFLDDRDIPERKGNNYDFELCP
jgi:phosphatidylinositol kinase/protein kinase (PI-3  family)